MGSGMRWVWGLDERARGRGVRGRLGSAGAGMVEAVEGAWLGAFRCGEEESGAALSSLKQLPAVGD